MLRSEIRSLPHQCVTVGQRRDALAVRLFTQAPTRKMLGISGVGPTKLEHYGERFIKALSE